MTETNEMRVFSFGGGWQSVAVLALQAMGKLPKPYDAFVFASVGYESEPETHDYFNEVALPFAEEFGIRLEMTMRRRKDGTEWPLLESVVADNRTIPIPVYMANGAPGNRSCTGDWKITVIDKWIRAQGATSATIGLGISMDEGERVRPAMMEWHKVPGFRRRVDYPLIGLRLFRENLQAVYAEAGIPGPPKSACFYCPFSSRSRWIEMKRNDPQRFAQAIEIQNIINAKREKLGRDAVTIHPDGLLENVVGDQLPLFDFETGGGCNSGTCFT